MKPRENKKCKVGELRPSQILTTFGIGSIIDLPNFSVMVMGLEEWSTRDTLAITEERLLASVRESLGGQVQSLRTAPMPPETNQVNPFDGAQLIGVPVSPFPRWMVCTYCQRLAHLSSGLFKLETGYRPDQIKYVHTNCIKRGKSPLAVPARFIIACQNGHLDDFPWHDFVRHNITNCKGSLRLVQLTPSGEAAGIEVKCDECQGHRRMSDAFRIDSGLGFCKGRRPHLRDKQDDPCKDTSDKPSRLRAITPGASNIWFPMMLSVLSIPQGVDELANLVTEHWGLLEHAKDAEGIRLLLTVVPQLRDLVDYSPEDVWKQVENRKGEIDQDPVEEKSDIKAPEWEVFCAPELPQSTKDFQLKSVRSPRGYEPFFEKIVLVEKLKEVRALIGFARIESPSDYDTPSSFPPAQQVPLSRTKPKWVPSTEIRGEGIFFQFKEEMVQKWCVSAKEREQVFLESHKAWRGKRGLMPVEQFFPGIRFILLHSFAHALIRQLSVECGYSAASIRERIYSRNPGDESGPMAGVLIYTAAADSEGTLGGLVSLGKPDSLGRHLDMAFDSMRLCASDPLCAEHLPSQDGEKLHGASCHACLFAPETSCEKANRYLDRTVLVPTLEESRWAFFGKKFQ